jgi:hypothetical protein
LPENFVQQEGHLGFYPDALALPGQERREEINNMIEYVNKHFKTQQN